MLTKKDGAGRLLGDLVGGGEIERNYTSEFPIGTEPPNAIGSGPAIPEPPPSAAPTLAPFTTDYENGYIPGTSNPGVEEDASWAFGWITYLVIATFLSCILWKCCFFVRRRREARMLTVQADHVLGDMQMVPNDDFDGDNELL